MFFQLGQRALFALDPERAHGLGLKALESAYRLGLSPLLAPTVPERPLELWGLKFANPVGLAAGMDKNGAHIDALARLGFGFIEIGTVTPRAQPGNTKPRMYRLVKHQAVINRLGFNNDGVAALLKNVECAQRRCVLGINIGKNKDTPNERADDDYADALKAVYRQADYITVNISSPNTEGLRGLQASEPLARLLYRLKDSAGKLALKAKKQVPLLVKVAPDLTPAEVKTIAEVIKATQIDGLIATNTTIDRSAVAGHRHAEQAGGLSGAPLMERSTAVLRAFRRALGNDLPIIGVGGILNGADARAKFDAGADLVQFYTGLIYRGPTLIRECVEAWPGPRRRGKGAA